MFTRFNQFSWWVPPVVLLLGIGGAPISEPDRTNLDALPVVERSFSYSRSFDEGAIGAAEASVGGRGQP